MNNKVKIIFLSQVAGEIVFELSEIISEEIGETIFITGSGYKEIDRKLTIIDAPKYDNRSYFLRVWTWILYLLFTIFVLIRIKGRAILIISSNPPFLPLVGYIFKKFRGWQYIVRVLDVYPDVISQNGLIKKENVFYKLWASLNRLVNRHADHVISLGYVMANRISQYMEHDKKVIVLPDWVNVEKFKPIFKEQNWFANKYFKKNDLNIVYAGNLGLTHDVKTLFDGIKLLQNEKGITFTIVGGGVHKEDAINNANIFSNLNYLPYQPKDTLPYLLSSADVAIICMGKESEGISMPSKLYYSMASGSAILSISSKNNDLKDIVDESNCGINIDNGDIKGFIDAVMKFNNNNEFLEACQENSRNIILTKFSSHIIIPKYLAILNDMLKHE
jgi:glycosyltransferase involved in cell wall biosynthesis